MPRDKIREYIKKQVGRDPQDNFDVVRETENEIKVRVRFSLRPEDDLTLVIPNKGGSE